MTNRNQSSRAWIAAIFILCAVVFMLGALSLLGRNHLIRWEANRIAHLPEFDIADFTDAPRSAIVLHGTLAHNEALTSEDLVAYTYTEIRTRTPILKEPSAKVPPPILRYGAPQRFRLADQLHIPTLILATSDSSSSAQVEIRPWLFSTMGGGMHLSRSLHSANITGARGYSNGDNITVVGWKRDGNTMIAVHYYGGPREQLVQNLARQIPDYRRFSGILMFGATFVYLGTVLMSNRKRRWKYD